MATAVWRYLLSAIALFALFIAVGDAFDANRLGDTGIGYSPTSNDQAVITDVEPSSVAAHIGVRPGDRIRAGWIRFDTTFQPYNYPLGIRAGELVAFYDFTLRRQVTVVAAPLASMFSGARIVAYVLRILILLLALTLFWTIPQDRAGRALGAFLLCYEIQGFSNTGSFAVPILVSATLIGTAAQVMLPMLLLFVCWFPNRYPVDVRRVIAVVGSVFGAFMVLLQLTSTAYAATGSGLHIPSGAFLSITQSAAPIIFAGLFVTTIFIDFRKSSPMERLRLEWVAVGAGVIAFNFVTVTYFPSSFQTFGRVFNGSALAISDIGDIVGVACIAYAFLRYRVLDLTFAISQATVYALLSTFIVGAFIIVEYLVGKYVETHSHLTGAIITLAFALTLGFGLRALHLRVDRFADRIIFRSRHRAEEGLRSFGRRASFFASEKGLQEMAVEVLVEYARAQSAAIYLADSEGDFMLSACYPGNPAHGISHEDPVVLAMKDERRPVLIGKASRVDGELALPMFVRGDLIGFAICGKRRVRETYAPDEIDAMNYALEHVGIQLHAIRTARLHAQLREIKQLVCAHELFGADAERVLAQISRVSGAKESGYEEPTPWTLTRAAGQSAPKTSNTT